MVGPEGVGCLSDVLHRGSGNHHGMRVLSVHVELIIKRLLLSRDVLPYLTYKKVGRVFPHIKFNNLY